MRIAFGAAMAERLDYYLWINDDIELYSDSIMRAVETSRRLAIEGYSSHIVGGAMRDPFSGKTSYGGQVRSSKIFPWKYKVIDPDPDSLIDCDVLNGNFMLIPRLVAARMGNIHAAYIQLHGDFDYTLKAKRKGTKNVLLPGYAGACEVNLTGEKISKIPLFRSVKDFVACSIPWVIHGNPV